MKKQELRKIIKEELTIWEKDRESAEKIKSELISTYSEVENAIKLINKNLSEFNSPGLITAFVKGLKAGVRSHSKFDMSLAKKELDEYFNR